MFCGMSFTSSTRCSERYSDRRATSSSPGRGPSRTRAAGLFKTLGRRDEFQKIEMESANRFHQDALALCKTYNVQSERALDRAQGGLGIGLALVRELVSLHGGTVRAVSAGEGLGSEFLVRLPAAPEL